MWRSFGLAPLLLASTAWAQVEIKQVDCTARTISVYVMFPFEQREKLLDDRAVYRDILQPMRSLVQQRCLGVRVPARDLNPSATVFAEGTLDANAIAAAKIIVTVGPNEKFTHGQLRDRAGRYMQSTQQNASTGWTRDADWNRDDLDAIKKQQAEQVRERQADEKAEAMYAAIIKDCGPSPTLTGGPWLNQASYKQMALDEIKVHLAHWICVKSIEYMGAAASPFGGNVATVKYIGYSRREPGLIYAIRVIQY